MAESAASSLEIAVQELRKSFGAHQVLRGIDFSLRSGEIFGFVGSNGAGKTTTMRIIMGLTKPDSGQVNWADAPITAADRTRIGYMPEERGLYPKMSGHAQLEYLARLHGATKADANQQIDRWAARLGILPRLKDPLEKLSLGNQQRVQLLSTLVFSPAALILDEPFSGLDPLAVEAMSEVLRAQAKAGVPVMFSSHQLDLVERLCDVVGIIADGKMVAVGSVEELRRSREGERCYLVTDAPGAASVAEDEIWRRFAEAPLQLNNGYTRFSLPLPAASPEAQALLKTALAAGQVSDFGDEKLSLTELYHDVVATSKQRPANREGESK